MENHLALQVIKEWKQYALEEVKRATLRDIDIEFPAKGAVALIGIRRSGKTSMALIKACEVTKSNFLYINFEDPAFIEDNTHLVFDQLIEIYTEYEGHYPQVIIFDELQNIQGWERWVRKFVDLKKAKLIITGSSAKMLSQELSTSIAGRALTTKILPLSFSEFLQFKKEKPEHQGEYLALLKEFIGEGGFPEVVLEKEISLKKKILSQYFTDIVLKDIIQRNEIRDKHVLDKIINHYFINISSHHSSSALKKAYGLGLQTAQMYTEYLKDAFLLFEVQRFHRNLKVQSRDSKKVYVADTGLRNYNSRNLTDDHGKLLENIVYLQLLRSECDIYYYKDSKEVDFLILENKKPVEAIQVCDSNLENPETYDREVEGLIECMTNLNIERGLILTRSRSENKTIKGFKVKFKPAYEWLLGLT